MRSTYVLGVGYDAFQRQMCGPSVSVSRSYKLLTVLLGVDGVSEGSNGKLKCINNASECVKPSEITVFSCIKLNRTSGFTPDTYIGTIKTSPFHFHVQTLNFIGHTCNPCVL